MGGCLGLSRPSKVVPLPDHSEQYACGREPAASNGCTSGGEHATKALNTTLNTDVRHGQQHQSRSQISSARASEVDKLLAELLTTAGLVPQDTNDNDSASFNQHTSQKLPSSLDDLQKRLAAACKKHAQVIQAIESATTQLLEQFKQEQRLQTVSSIHIPAADMLTNILNMVMFAQVTLHDAAGLRRRYMQYSQLLAALGLDDSRLAACVQPSNKAFIACLLLGSKAIDGELRVSCIVHRCTAFWDALEQLQQQGIVQPDNNQQVAGAVQLAKLFPRFVDERLVQQQHYPQKPSSSMQVGTVLGSSNTGRAPAVPSAVPIEWGEGHGPRKEFFQLVGENITRSGAMDQQPALFIQLCSPGTWWFNTTLSQSSHLQAAYWAVGWLLGQALVNRCTLGVQLAPLLLDRLLLPQQKAFKPDLAMLQQHDQEAAQAVKGVQQLPAQQFTQLLELEGKPGNMTKQQYIEQAVQQLLVADVAWQYEALHRGFFAVLDLQVLHACCFTGACLTEALCGPAGDPNADFDVRQVFRVVVEDEEAYSSSAGGNQSPSSVALLLQCLWQVLSGWPPLQKRAFIKFVTGSDRLPPPGSEQLLVSFPFVAYSANQQRQLLGTLPQSHTCANTLELPNYVEALVAAEPGLAKQWQQRTRNSDCNCILLKERCCEVLADRLKVASTSCDSYGLDEFKAASIAPTTNAQHALIEASSSSRSSSSYQDDNRNMAAASATVAVAGSTCFAPQSITGVKVPADNDSIDCVLLMDMSGSFKRQQPSPTQLPQCLNKQQQACGMPLGVAQAADVPLQCDSRQPAHMPPSSPSSLTCQHHSNQPGSNTGALNKLQQSQGHRHMGTATQPAGHVQQQDHLHSDDRHEACSAAGQLQLTASDELLLDTVLEEALVL